MRKSRIFALVVASLVSSASYAQAQSASPAPTAARHGMHGGRHGGMRGERRHGGALRGITLSDAEKTKVKAIHARYATDGKSLRESLKPAMQEARTARQKGDTVAAKAAWARNRDGRDQLKALHDREQSEIRSALSPDNQKVFDTNMAQRAQRRAEWEKKGGRKGAHMGRRMGTNG